MYANWTCFDVYQKYLSDIENLAVPIWLNGSMWKRKQFHTKNYNIFAYSLLNMLVWLVIWKKK